MFSIGAMHYSSQNWCPESGFWRNFTMVAWVISRKPKNVWFPAVKKFWDIVWHSNYHRSKARVKRNKSIVKKIRLENEVLLSGTRTSTLQFFKKAFFLRFILGSKFSPFLRRLMFEKIYVSTISQKNIENIVERLSCNR